MSAPPHQNASPCSVERLAGSMPAWTKSSPPSSVKAARRSDVSSWRWPGPRLDRGAQLVGPARQRQRAVARRGERLGADRRHRRRASRRRRDRASMAALRADWARIAAAGASATSPPGRRAGRRCRRRKAWRRARNSAAEDEQLVERRRRRRGRGRDSCRDRPGGRRAGSAAPGARGARAAAPPRHGSRPTAQTRRGAPQPGKDLGIAAGGRLMPAALTARRRMRAARGLRPRSASARRRCVAVFSSIFSTAANSRTSRSSAAW